MSYLRLELPGLPLQDSSIQAHGHHLDGPREVLAADLQQKEIVSFSYPFNMVSDFE